MTKEGRTLRKREGRSSGGLGGTASDACQDIYGVGCVMADGMGLEYCRGIEGNLI